MFNSLHNLIRILLAGILLNIAVYGLELEGPVPETNFRCGDQEYPGYFADTELECQAFHICVDHVTRYSKFSFWCPNGTSFDQTLLVCSWKHNVDCLLSSSLYHKNRNIYQNNEDNSNEIFNENFDAIAKTGVNRRGKSLPDNFIEDDPQIVIEGSSPVESRRQAGILSAISISSKKQSKKKGGQNNLKLSQNFDKTLDISSKSRRKFSHTENHDKLDSGKRILNQKLSLPNRIVKNKSVSIGQTNSLNNNDSTNISGKNKITSSPLLSTKKDRKISGSIFNQRSRTPVSSKISNKTTSTSIKKVANNSTLKSKNKTIVPFSNDSSLALNKFKFSQRDLPIAKNERSKVSNKKKIDSQKITGKQGGSQTKFNIPKSRLYEAGIFSNNLTPPNRVAAQIPANILKTEKVPILIISSAEAETNKDDQKRVYVNRLQFSNRNNASADFVGKPLKIGIKEKKSRIIPNRKVSSNQGSRSSASSLQASRRNSTRLKPVKSSKITKNPRTQRRRFQQTRKPKSSPSFQRTTFRDESLEEGKLGLIASSILKLQPRFF